LVGTSKSRIAKSVAGLLDTAPLAIAIEHPSHPGVAGVTADQVHV
jgi:Mg-chelatase subunit ChlI